MIYRSIIAAVIVLFLLVSSAGAVDGYIILSYGNLVRRMPSLGEGIWLDGTPEKKWDTFGLGAAFSFSRWTPELEIEFFLSPKKGDLQQVGGLAGVRQRFVGPFFGTLGVGIVSENTSREGIIRYWVNANTGAIMGVTPATGDTEEMAYVLTYGISIEPIRTIRFGVKIVKTLSGDTRYAESFELTRFSIEFKI